MSEQSAEPSNQQADETNAPQEGEAEAKTFDADYVAKLRKENAKYRTDANAATAELEKVRKSAMTESEKAVAEAEARGRTTAATEFGKELAQTQFDAAAGRRNPDFDTAKALEFVDLGKFLTEEGRPDAKAIAAAVERLVPEPHNGPPSLDGGARANPPKNADMNALLRRGR